MSRILGKSYTFTVRNKHGKRPIRGQSSDKRDAGRAADRLAKLYGEGATIEQRVGKKGGMYRQATVTRNTRGRLVITEQEL